MASKEPPRGFTAAEWLGVGLLLIVITSAVLLVAYRLNINYQQRQFAESISTVGKEIGVRMGETRAVVNSMLGVHYASLAQDGNELTTLANEFLKQSDFVSGIGRFVHVKDESRQDFEGSMAENGVYAFAVHNVDASGNIGIRARADDYNAITMAEPTSPTNTAALGIDLNTSQHFAGSIEKAIKSGQSFFTRVPGHWPIDAQLLIVSPSYLGRIPPADEIERKNQFEGGYWLAIDIENIDLSTFKFERNLTLSVMLRDASGQRTLLEKSVAGQDTILVFPSLYKPEPRHIEWRIGNSRLLFIAEPQHGIAIRSVLLTALALVVSLALMCTVFLFFHIKRVADFDRNRNLRTIYDQRERAEKTLNAIIDSVFTLDSEMRISHLNPAAQLTLGTDLQSAKGRCLNEIIDLEQLDDIESSGLEPPTFNLAAAMQKLPLSEKNDYNLALSSANADPISIKLTLSRTLDNDGAPSGFIIVMRDVSEEKRLHRQLEYQANHDPLTKSKNRFYFEKRLERLIESTKTGNRQHALCYIDLDQFKIVNDTCGHAAGDALLKELTGTIQSTIRPSDILARLGGDEFGLLLIDVTREQAEKRANQIFQFFQDCTFSYQNKAFAVRASIGFVLINEQSGSISDVMAAADIACYTAKDGGRNSIHYYSENNETMSQKHEEMKWLPALQKAIDDNSFRLLVQPIAKIHPQDQSYSIHHFEFLLRLVNAEGQETTPHQFIQAAERYDLMKDIDRWVISNAFKSISDLDASTPEQYFFAINLSGQSAADPTLLDFIEQQLQLHNVDPTLLCFELTETAAISHFSVALKLINEIRGMGSRVALDDFGSGLSSFGYLKKFPVDILKIDGQFVRDIHTNPIDREMVRALNQVAKAMQIETIAEFVESGEILNELMEIGIDYAQGYYIGKPCKLEEALQLTVLRNAA